MSPTPINERRRSRRRKPSQLVYLEFGRDNGGMVKDVSEDGLRFSLMGPVVVGQNLQFSINLDSSRRIAGQAKMIWTEAHGKSGGMSFEELSEQSRETLRAWLAEIDGPTAAPLSVTPPAKPLAQPRVPPDCVPTPPAISAPAAQVPAPVPAPQNPAVQAAVAEAPGSPVRPAPIPVASAPAALASVAPAPVAPAPVARVPVAELPTAQNIPAPSFVAQVAAAPNPAPPIPTELPPVPPAKASPQTPIESPEDVRPVTREDWIRAARENLVPGERSPRSSLPAMALAGPPSARPPASTSGTEDLQALVSTILFDKKPPEATAKFERIAQAVDPLREFLRQPDEDTEIAYTPAEHIATLDDDKPRAVWSTSRLIMVLSLAAICGVAAAFAAIAYRQTLGESLIELGEKIGGQPRTNSPGNADHPPASPSVDSQTTTPPADSPKPANKRTVAPASSSTASPANSPAAQPVAPQPASPISQFRPQSIQPSAIPEPELAAGREIIPGKPKRPPEDVASLWIAVENGDTLAEVHLANRYISGDGVEKNCDQARVLLQAAAKHGDELAAKRLAQLSTNGCQ